ncbi:MAG: FAD-binding domain-containing protein [Verrucomicrobiota bacterium]
MTFVIVRSGVGGIGLSGVIVRAMGDFPNVPFAQTRAEALARLEEFLPEVGRYSSRRNHIEPGHGNVSRLSPAIRARVLLETEVAGAVRERFSPSTMEKFEQEIWWRLYWKGWLEMRPAVWASFRRELAALEWSDRARAVAAGESGVAIMDHFAKELIETGYLHNHARMWWAAFWIHVEGLPWQLGAGFFHRHLLDGDAASNTLSWRWVAGLHTRGKAYLVRRSNVEKYVDDSILANAVAGIERLEGTTEREVEFVDPPAPERISHSVTGESEARRTGLWLHDEDLFLERSPLADLSIDSIAAFALTELEGAEADSILRRDFHGKAIEDGLARASNHFQVEKGFRDASVSGEALMTWARKARLDRIVAMRPFVGPLADRLSEIEETLEASGVKLELIRRTEDVEAMNRATAGFFGFWKKTGALREEAFV